MLDLEISRPSPTLSLASHHSCFMGVCWQCLLKEEIEKLLNRKQQRMQSEAAENIGTTQPAGGQNAY